MADQARRWEPFIVFSGVIVSIPVLAFLATGVANLFTTDREGLDIGILLAIIALAVIWLAVMGALWILSGDRTGTPAALDDQISELQEENRRLTEIVSNLSEALDNLSDTEHSR